MSYLNKNITAEILLDHFRYFQLSQFFLEKYKKIVFREDATIPFHLAYLCPLCLEKYIVLHGNDLNLNTEFSLDHIPPKSIGGTLMLITCKKCNNDAGKYEAELEFKLNYGSFCERHIDSEIGNTKFKISGVEGNYKSFLKVSEDGMPIIHFPTNAKETPYLNNWLNNLDNMDNWSVTFTIPTPNDKNTVKALLKSAYLISFFYWGYEFAYSKNGDFIRKVLNDKEEYPMNNPVIWCNKHSLKSETDLPFGIGIIESPVELQSYYVNIPIEKNGTTYIAIILIPNPTEEGWGKLKDINSYLINNNLKEVRFKPLFPSLPKVTNGYNSIWESFINKKI